MIPSALCLEKIEWHSTQRQGSGQPLMLYSAPETLQIQGHPMARALGTREASKASLRMATCAALQWEGMKG